MLFGRPASLGRQIQIWIVVKDLMTIVATEMVNMAELLFSCNIVSCKKFILAEYLFPP